MPFAKNWKLEIEGYEAFCSKIKELEDDRTKRPIFILYTGSDGLDGKSWCPDCLKFEKQWDELSKTFTPKKGTLITVKVGNRESWKDKENPFRTDKKTFVKSIPTVAQWNTMKRLWDSDLDEEHFRENLEMLFEDDVDDEKD